MNAQVCYSTNEFRTIDQHLTLMNKTFHEQTLHVCALVACIFLK